MNYGYPWPPQYVIMQPPQNDKPPMDMPKPDKKEKSFVDILRENEEQNRELDRYLEYRKTNKKHLDKKEAKKLRWYKVPELWLAFSFGSFVVGPMLGTAIFFAVRALAK